MTFTYRPRQLSAHAAARQAVGARKRKAIIIQAPTGFGKTGIAALFCEAALRKSRCVLFIADRKKLIRQAQHKLADFGVRSGIIMSGHRIELVYSVQVASVQTLVRRLGQFAFKPDLIIIDECHRSNGDSFKRIIEYWPDAVKIGLTATPCRTDGTGLGVGHGGIFEEIIPTAAVRELIDDGTLCPYRYFLPELMDTSGLHVKRGEIDTQEFDARMDSKPTIVGDFIAYWLAHAKGRPTLTFASSITEAGRLCAAANAAGIRAIAIDADNQDQDGDSALAGLSGGTVDMVILVGCWVEGMDCPEVSCIALMTYTASLTKFMQMIGRGFRYLPGKVMMVIDHMGNAGRMVNGEFVPKHGLPDQDREWSLEGTKRGNSAEKPQPLRQCPQCQIVHTPAPRCPECGWLYEIAARTGPEQVAGQIVEVSPEAVAAAKTAASVERKREIGQAKTREQLEAIAAARGYKRGWADYILRARKQKGERRA